jgi:hypothetical protein
MDGLDSLTVVELKQLLKEKGLPVSGKKAELLERLMANDEGGSIGLKQQPEQQLPFLTSLFQKGLSSVNVDRKLALHYGAALIMLIFMISGLNSNSWYYMEWSKTDGNPDMGMYADEKTTLYFGLSDIEILYEVEGIIWGETVDTEDSEHEEYDSAACKSTEEFSCESFSTAGTLNQISLWVSILCIFLIFGLGIARGFGKEITPQFHMHEQKILNIAWALAAFLPFIGTLCYGFIIGLSEMDMSEWDNYGFGFMWWSMMMFSFLFAGLVYSQQISSMISRFKQVPAK